MSYYGARPSPQVEAHSLGPGADLLAQTVPYCSVCNGQRQPFQRKTGTEGHLESNSFQTFYDLTSPIFMVYSFKFSNNFV